MPLMLTASFDWQGLFILLVIVALFYGVSGYLLRSTTAGGKLSWSGRRWRWTFTAALALSFVGMEAANAPNVTFRVTVWGAVGLLGILFIRWWWRDWEKEKAAREALVKKLHQEGRELVLPQRSRGQKVWNWVLIAYGGLGLLGGVYEIILHLLGKAH